MTIPLYVGFDQREAVAYHVFCQSVIERATAPVGFFPLAAGLLWGFDGQKDGSNAFVYSRFLVPYLQGFKGWAIFADGDMVCRDDIDKLWDLRKSSDKALLVVKHHYETKNRRKYVGTGMESVNSDYPKKNHSSVMLWNCEHLSNRVLTPAFVAESSGSTLHRFSWLDDSQVGILPVRWNWLIGEYGTGLGAGIHHHTLGIPAISHYQNADQAEHWHRAYLNAVHMDGQNPVEIAQRAVSYAAPQNRVGNDQYLRAS